MIEIKKPNITIENGIAILECKILINDMEKNLFYEIDQEYKEYLIKYRLLLRVYKVDFVVLNNDVDEVIKNETLKDYNLIYSNPTFSVYELKG